MGRRYPKKHHLAINLFRNGTEIGSIPAVGPLPPPPAGSVVELLYFSPIESEPAKFLG